MAITEVPLERVAHYGIVNGIWEDDSETMMKVECMVEKPTDDYAREYLGVRGRQGKRKYYATFGQYVLTQEVFSELEKQIVMDRKPSEGKEFGLTAALEAVQEKVGMAAFVPGGKSFDIGLPETYRETVWEFCGK